MSVTRIGEDYGVYNAIVDMDKIMCLLFNSDKPYWTVLYSGADGKRSVVISKDSDVDGGFNITFEGTRDLIDIPSSWHYDHYTRQLECRGFISGNIYRDTRIEDIMIRSYGGHEIPRKSKLDPICRKYDFSDSGISNYRQNTRYEVNNVISSCVDHQIILIYELPKYISQRPKEVIQFREDHDSDTIRKLCCMEPIKFSTTVTNSDPKYMYQRYGLEPKVDESKFEESSE